MESWDQRNLAFQATIDPRALARAKKFATTTEVMLANWMPRFRKRGPCPQKVGSKPERREVSAAASVGLERSPQGTKTVYKRTVQAQRDFLRGGAVLRPSGARLALTKPAGETDPNGEAAFCAEKCGEPQGFAATWCARLDSNQRSRLPARSVLNGPRRGPRPYRVVVIRPSKKKPRFTAGFGYIPQK